MKILKYFASALALAALFTACSDDEKYQPAELPGTQEAYFPATAMTVSCEETTDGFDVEIARVNYKSASTAVLTSTAPAGVHVPASVSFSEGQEKTSFKVGVDQSALEQGETYSVEILVSANDNSPYANQRCTVKLTTWSPAPPVSWEPVETECAIKNTIMGIVFTAQDIIYDVYVEKRTDRDIFRVANVFTSYTVNGKTYTYPYYTAGDEVAPIDQPTWLIVDCSGYYGEQNGWTGIEAGKAWTPFQTTNADWGYGEMLFGSVAYNLSSSGVPLTPDRYLVGTYDAEAGTITLGQLALQLTETENAGLYLEKSTNPEDWTTIYLDKSKMGTDFERDCTFSKYMDGVLNSELAEDHWAVSLHTGVPDDEEKAAEYAKDFGTVYMVPDMYGEGCPIYFTEKDGKISVPEEYALQELGGEMFGFELYAAITGGTYADNVYTIMVEVIGKDPAGVKDDITFGEYTEVIDAEAVNPAQSIDDFCGTFSMSGIYVTDTSDETVPTAPFSGVPVTITKQDETTAILTGLVTATDRAGLGEDFNDEIVLTYADGYLSMTVQDLPDWTNVNNVTFDVYATLFNLEGSYYNKNAIGLLNYKAGLTDTGEIKFFNDAANAQYGVEVAGMGLVGEYGGKPYLITEIPWYLNVRLGAAGESASAYPARKDYVTKFIPATKVVTELTRHEVTKQFKPKQAGKPIAAPAANSRKLSNNRRSNFVEL